MDSKEKLIKSALTLFSEKGYDGVTVQDICSLSGLTKPTLYHYYGSKLGIFSELFKIYGTPLLEKLNEHSPYSHDITKTLNELTVAVLPINIANGEFFKIIMMSKHCSVASEQGPISRQFVEALFRPLVELFVKAENDHGSMRNKAVFYAATYLSLLETTSLLCIEGKLVYSPELAYRIVHQFMYGLFN